MAGTPMKQKVIPELNDAGEVIGATIILQFATGDFLKRSKDGKGPNWMDFTTSGNHPIQFESAKGEPLAIKQSYQMGINIYHK